MNKKVITELNYFEGRHKKMRRLVDEYGIKGSQLSLQQCVWEIEKEQKNKGGRPVDFSLSQLMQIWLYVEEAKARSGRAAEAICRDKKAVYYYRVQNGDDGIVANSLKGTTLLRRYREANALLKASSVPHKKLPKGFTIKIEGVPVEDISPLEKYWRAELQRRLGSQTVR